MTRPQVRLFRMIEHGPSPAAANDRSFRGTETVAMSGVHMTGLPARPSYRERAQALFDHRRNRQRWFGEHAKVLQDAGWDILLELFLCQEDCRDPSTTSVAYGAGIPLTTALRMMKKLEAIGLIVSHTDLVDLRVRRISMTADAVSMMRGYLDDV